MTGAPASCLVVGLGNPDRGDDAVGWIVAIALAGRHLDGVAVRCHVEPIDLLEELADAEVVVIVDAEVSGATPGTVLVREVGSLPLRQCAVSHAAHSIGVADVIELARALGRLPNRLFVVGIEAASFADFAALTPQVRDAVDRAADTVADLARLRRKGHDVPR